MRPKLSSLSQRARSAVRFLERDYGQVDVRKIDGGQYACIVPMFNLYSEVRLCVRALGASPSLAITGAAWADGWRFRGAR